MPQSAVSRIVFLGGNFSAERGGNTDRSYCDSSSSFPFWSRNSYVRSGQSPLFFFPSYFFGVTFSGLCSGLRNTFLLLPVGGKRNRKAPPLPPPEGRQGTLQNSIIRKSFFIVSVSAKALATFPLSCFSFVLRGVEGNVSQVPETKRGKEPLHSLGCNNRKMSQDSQSSSSSSSSSYPHMPWNNLLLQAKEVEEEKGKKRTPPLPFPSFGLIIHSLAVRSFLCLFDGFSTDRRTGGLRSFVFGSYKVAAPTKEEKEGGNGASDLRKRPLSYSSSSSSPRLLLLPEALHDFGRRKEKEEEVAAAAASIFLLCAHAAPRPKRGEMPSSSSFRLGGRL